MRSIRKRQIEDMYFYSPNTDIYDMPINSDEDIEILIERMLSSYRKIDVKNLEHIDNKKKKNKRRNIFMCFSSN